MVNNSMIQLISIVIFGKLIVPKRIWDSVNLSCPEMESEFTSFRRRGYFLRLKFGLVRLGNDPLALYVAVQLCTIALFNFYVDTFSLVQILFS